MKMFTHRTFYLLMIVAILVVTACSPQAAGVPTAAQSESISLRLAVSDGDDSDYQGAESGLLQGSTLTGRPAATNNVTFFPKYQVLFANGPAFKKLSSEQRTVLQEAATAAQKKALAEHPGDVAAGTAWCADGGTIVLASNEQVAAFQKAAQPVFNKQQQDSFNAESISAIRELKAKTKASPGAQACAPTVAIPTQASAENQTWSQGLPPNGIWQVELTTDDFIKMGTLKSTADDMAGVYTLKFKDGKSQIDIQRAGLTSSCLLNVTVVGDAVRLQNVGSSTCDGNAYDDVQWRLDTDGLHFHLVSTQAVELKTLYESKPWQKVESWSDGLPPNGKWTVDLSADDLVRMGDLKSVAQDWAGQYTLTLKDGKSLGEYHAANGFYGKCQANYEVVGDIVRFTYYTNADECPNEVDDMQWRLDDDGLHLHLVAIKNSQFIENKAYLEAKPWQKVADK